VDFIASHGKLNLSSLPTRGDIVYLAGTTGPASPRLSGAAVGEIDSFCVLPTITEMDISPAPSLGVVRVDPGPAGGWGTGCTGKHDTYLAELFSDQCCATGYAASTQTAVKAPLTVRSGEHVRFLVTVTDRPGPHREIAGTINPTPTPLTLSPCPAYYEELEGIAGAFYAYQLNCVAASPIEPNGSETFEMFIDVPHSAPAGPAVLLWSIDGSPTVWQSIRTNIDISS